MVGDTAILDATHGRRLKNNENCVVDLTSFLDFIILDTQEETHLGLSLRNSVAFDRGVVAAWYKQTPSSERKIHDSNRQRLFRRTKLHHRRRRKRHKGPGAEPTSSDVVPAGEPVAQPRATRASTRSKPNTDDTFDSSLTPR